MRSGETKKGHSFKYFQVIKEEKEIDMPIIPKFKKEPVQEEVIEEYAELPVEVSDKKKMNVVIQKMERFSDTDFVLKTIKEGNVVIAMIKDMKENNIDELKHSISKIKTACANINGNVMGLGEDILIIMPANVSIKK